MNELLYGVAYYDEYMPEDRLEKDIQMLKDANMNVVRIAESTWSTLEPQSGVFNFHHIDRVLDAMYEADIHVIVGTPTYAVPTWMVKEHPNILAVMPEGPNHYGRRQNMDITNPSYLFYAERVIRKLAEHVAGHKAVIGYQVDNETKHYGTCGPNVQLQFVKYMREKYEDLDSMNSKLGLDYWSNRINSWEDFPSIVGTINASLECDFREFQKRLVTDFLRWQVDIVNEYKKPGQFVTQNFDFDWRGYSFGVQSDVDHFKASAAMDIVGVDIYHHGQSELTGTEISFCGDSARSYKQAGYLVLETQAQGHAGWVPYPGQLRLQAYSHLASGAQMIEYWHWHSIHNSFETYWKGLLSHDFKPNPVYKEAMTIGADMKKLSQLLIGARKENKAAVYISQKSLDAMISFGRYWQPINYNDVMRLYYDALYRLNIECDIIDESFDNFSKYDLIVVPSLYSEKDDILDRFNCYVKDGGNVVFSHRSGFSDEHIKVRTCMQPGIISESCGVGYSLFVESKDTKLTSGIFETEDKTASLAGWMELLIPHDKTEVLASYDNPYWKEYAAITRNKYGKGTAIYVGCQPTAEVVEQLLERTAIDIGLLSGQDGPKYPLIVKKMISSTDKEINFYLNYSMNRVEATHNGNTFILDPWGVKITENKNNEVI